MPLTGNSILLHLLPVFGLRHCHARELAFANTPINVIQQQLGHSNISTTHVYLCKIVPQQVIDTMQSREWSL